MQKVFRMKIYKQAVLIQKDDGYLEVISYYDLHSQTFGIEVFSENKLLETIHPLQQEPERDKMRSIGTNFTIRNDETSEV